MSASAPSLTDVLNNVLTALQTILYQITKAIADNAQVIATVIVIGGLAYMVARYGSRILRGALGLFRVFF